LTIETVGSLHYVFVMLIFRLITRWFLCLFVF